MECVCFATRLANSSMEFDGICYLNSLRCKCLNANAVKLKAVYARIRCLTQAAKMRGVSFDLFHNTGCIFTLPPQCTLRDVWYQLDCIEQIYIVYFEKYYFSPKYSSSMIFQYTNTILCIYKAEFRLIVAVWRYGRLETQKHPIHPGSWTWFTTSSPWWRWRNRLRHVPGRCLRRLQPSQKESEIGGLVWAEFQWMDMTGMSLYDCLAGFASTYAAWQDPKVSWARGAQWQACFPIVENLGAKRIFSGICW